MRAAPLCFPAHSRLFFRKQSSFASRFAARIAWAPPESRAAAQKRHRAEVKGEYDKITQTIHDRSTELLQVRETACIHAVRHTAVHTERASERARGAAAMAIA